ncbi:MAG: hypothetical protein AAF909_09400 [Pseudomonadota bacterium]
MSDRTEDASWNDAAFDEERVARERAAQESVRAQTRLLNDIDDANRSAWAWFPPIFVIAFSLLSFAGTFIGLRDIISTGDLRGGVVGDALVFALVLLATGAMVFFLRRAVMDFFTLGGIASLAAYLLLLFFSVTFGFAFYWGRLEASGQAFQGAQTSVERFTDEIRTSAFALRSTSTELSLLSDQFRQLAVREREVGGTCGDFSGAGDGPRTRHRERRAAEIAARVRQLEPRFATVQGPVAALEAELGKIEALAKPEPGVAPIADPGAARQAQFLETRRAARAAAVEINALANDPSLARLSGEFRQWGAEYQDPNFVRRDDPLGSAYKCIQADAGQMLINAGDRLANLPVVTAPDLPDYAGPEATREAVFRMLDTAGGVLGGGGGGLSALFSEEASALTPQGEAALRSSVGAAVRDATASAETSEPPVIAAAGLRPADRFPLSVAIIIDLLLFAFVLIERPGRRYFDRMKRRVSDAMKEEFNPLRMVALRQALDEDEDWGLLRRYRFDVEERTFVALPVDRMDHSYDEAQRIDIQALRDVVKVWARNGILRPTYFDQVKLRGILLDAGRSDLSEWRLLDCYEFSPTGFERLMLSNMAAKERARLAAEVEAERQRVAQREFELAREKMRLEEARRDQWFRWNIRGPKDTATPAENRAETVEAGGRPARQGNAVASAQRGDGYDAFGVDDDFDREDFEDDVYGDREFRAPPAIRSDEPAPRRAPAPHAPYGEPDFSSTYGERRAADRGYRDQDDGYASTDPAAYEDAAYGDDAGYGAYGHPADRPGAGYRDDPEFHYESDDYDSARAGADDRYEDERVAEEQPVGLIQRLTRTFEARQAAREAEGEAPLELDEDDMAAANDAERDLRERRRG